MAKPIARRPNAWRWSGPEQASFAPSDNSMASEASFRELFELHRDYLYRLGVKLSGNAETAKDLVQETFCRALQRFDKFQPGTNTRAWLATILTNHYYDLCKHDKVVKKAEGELAAAPEAIEAIGAIEPDSMIETVSDDYLHAAIEALEQEHREVIELCYLKQMRYREAAEALGVPLGTIGTRLMRARARLKILLIAMMRNGGRGKS